MANDDVNRHAMTAVDGTRLSVETRPAGASSTEVVAVLRLSHSGCRLSLSDAMRLMSLLEAACREVPRGV